jgi:FixJ family two-component response regulator
MQRLDHTVFIIDPDVSVRSALEAVIRRGGFVVESFTSAAAFLARARPLSPSALVLDVSPPDRAGFDLLRRIASDRRETPIIAVAAQGDIATIVQAMKAGAYEFLVKPLADEEVLVAVGQAIARSRTMVDGAMALMQLQGRHESLSSRERDVMALVVAGHLNKQIGAALGISEITVKAHRGKVMRKMHAGSLAELVMMAIRLDLPSLPTRTSSSIGFARPSHGLTDVAGSAPLAVAMAQ